MSLPTPANAWIIVSISSSMPLTMTVSFENGSSTSLGHVPSDCTDHMGLRSSRKRPLDRNALDGIIHREFGRKPFQIARQLAAVRAEQAGILDAAGILLQMLIDPVQPALVGQTGDEVQLGGDHFVGSRDQ